MDFNDYFAKRNELTRQIAVEAPEVSDPAPFAWLPAIGGSCLVGAAVLHVWASLALTDPGYFARTSTFLGFMLLAGVNSLVVAGLVSAWLTRARVQARESMKERTLSSLISADRVVAQRLAGELTNVR